MALVVQVVVFFLVGKLVPKLTNAVKDGQVAAARVPRFARRGGGHAERGVDDALNRAIAAARLDVLHRQYAYMLI